MSDTEIRRLRDQIAQLEARQKKSYKPGEMHAVVTNDASGRPITRYQGHEGACWDQFNPGTRYVTRILTPTR